jgi:hypothetical protein
MADTKEIKLLRIANEVRFIETYLLRCLGVRDSDTTSCYYAGSILISSLVLDANIARIAYMYLNSAILSTRNIPLEATTTAKNISNYLNGFKLALETAVSTSELLEVLLSYES